MPYRKKEAKSLFRKAMILVVVTLGVLGVFLAADLFKQTHYLVFASDLGLTEENCRCCHDTGVPDRHHLLIETGNYNCIQCHEFFYDEASSSSVPTITRDCLVCHVGSLADRHHIANQDCFACHEAIWDPDTQSYYMSFANGCAPERNLENCSDGVDNDSNGMIDCNDPYCAGTIPCLPDTIEICNDAIDNNGDSLVDCDDPACMGTPLCLPPEPEDCNDSIDNDANGLIDCADPACVAYPTCEIPPPEICDDGTDNDNDQRVDCNDNDCYGHANCTISSHEICNDTIDNDGNGLVDCNDPDCIGSVDCPAPEPRQISHFEQHQSPSSDCTACHLTNLHDQHQDNCNYCHSNPNIAIQQAVTAGNTSCTACHSATTHTMGCANCHKKPKSFQIDTVHLRHMDRVACGVCHEIPVTVNLEPTGQYCITCHSVARPYTHIEVPDLHRIHVTGRGNFPYACNMCHGQNIPQIRPEDCSACHPDNRLYNPVDLPTIHVTHSRLFDCTNCHFDPRLFALDDQATGCLRCHEMRTYSSTLEVHSLHIGQSCWTCHTSNGVTARSGNECASCHDGTTPSYQRLDRDVHKTHSVGAAPCWTCHSQLVPVFPTLQLSTASPGGSIAGTVTGPQGAVVDHVDVFMPECGHSSLTAEDGTYTLNFISPSVYTLNASKAGYQTASQTVEVFMGYVSTGDFSLTPLANTGTVSGLVLDNLGVPVQGVRVATADLEYEATTAADGSYVIAPIVAGSYQLTAVLYGYVDRTNQVAVAIGQTSNADFSVVQIGPEDCFDGFDNDDDGQIDCADQDCSNDCTGINEICGDTIDNDFDGDIDCFDQDCNSVCNGCTDIDGDGYYIDGGVCGFIDCNDANPQVHQGILEICDGIDNNCVGGVDEGLTTRYYLDSDGDGFGKPTVYTDACSQPAGYVLDNTDCNDTSSAAYPGGIEVCDGLDNNCDGQVDEGLTSTFYLDGDNDGFGSVASDIEACSQPAGYVTDATDCNDNNDLVHPSMTETCNGVDDNCSGQTDEGVTLTFYLDSDGDSFGDAASPTQACSAPAGYVTDSTDCNDGSAAAYPGAAEVCDGIDNNCDSQIDEGVTSTFYLDSDGDSYGDAGNPTQACSQPAGYVTDSTDCNDGSAAAYPGAAEVCDGIDNNCDTQIDEGLTSTFYRDSDNDTYGDAGNPTQACSQPAGYVTDSTDCNDGSAAAYPGAAEVCDGIDNNCDTQIDEGLTSTFYRDSDNDTYGDAGNPTQACSQPAGYVTDSTDCNDGSAAAYPGAAEVCDGIDNNCDSQIDEGGTNIFYLDADGDGYGDAASTTQDCNAPAGYVTDSTDCNDASTAVNPGASENCSDGIDNDCNGLIDANDGPCQTTCTDADNDGFSIEGGSCGQVDCNDSNNAINPGATEIFGDGLDNDCNGLSDCQDPALSDTPACTAVVCTDIGNEASCVAEPACYWWTGKKGKNSECRQGVSCTDSDGDGYSPDGGACGVTDCNDNAAGVNPGAGEICDDGLDNDCNGQTDTADAACQTPCTDVDDDGYSPDGGACGLIDCNDNAASIHPNAGESCNGVDDNCNGQTDEGAGSTFYFDGDSDGFGNAGNSTQACSQPAGYVSNASDCNDGDALIHPNATEICDGIDNNCDTQIDEGLSSTYYRDFDADGFGDPVMWESTCTGPSSGYISDNTDCNDANSSVYPGASETCDGIDNNCDGQIDEGHSSVTYYRDFDADGYGDPATSESSCSGPSSGYILDNTDCNDASAAAYPGAAEVCDGLDNNCDGQTDEGLTSTYYRDADGDFYGDAASPTQACSQPAGYVSDSTDCNDSNNAVNPAASEILGDDIDNNCDGLTDCEDPAFVDDPACQPPVSCDEITEQSACIDAGCSWNSKKNRCR